MNYRRFAGTIGLFALVASSVWTPGSAHAIGFTPPPNSGAPKQSTGGASRGNFFKPAPTQRALHQATGGASRGTLFQPNANRRAPRQATGGASRGTLFQPNANRRAPRQTAGGAAREGIQHIDPSIVGAAGAAAMMAILPETYFGNTISERPSILVYLPASPAEQAMFSLKDEEGNTLYEMSFPVSGEAGVLMVEPPANAPALEVGKNYQWFLALKVDGTLTTSTPYVNGWVQRIQPSAELTAALNQVDALKRAEILGKNGVWYDCAATLAMLRNSQPTSDALNKHWGELMADIGLQEVNEAPVMVSIN